MTQYTILSTKKISAALKEQAAQKGIEVMEKEFISTIPVTGKEKEVQQFAVLPSDTAVVFTSRHAVENTLRYFHPGNLPQWKICCLDGATKDAVAAQLPASIIITTATSAEALAEQIIASAAFTRVIFFCGNKRRNELPDRLEEKGIEVKEVTVYETMETPVQISGQPDAILFFSPSAVSSFFSVNTLTKKTACFAIGATTAGAIAEYTNNRIITSESPTPEAMLSAVWLYFQQINCYE